MSDTFKAMIEQSEVPSLVKYNNPFMVSLREPPKPKPIDYFDANIMPKEYFNRVETDCAFSKPESDELLNTILPPKEWVDDNRNFWRQTVATSPSTRLDVVTLEQQMNDRLIETGARESGLCEIRRELYRQCFDELIRQITISFAERGYMFLRVRDEAQMSMEEHRALFESAAAYGVRKILQAKAKIVELQLKYEEALATNNTIKEAIERLRKKKALIKRDHLDEEDEENLERSEEMTSVLRTNQQIKTQLLNFLLKNKTTKATFF